MNKRDTKAVIKKITDLPSNSDNFFEIYKAVSGKYWTLPPNADEFFQARDCIQKIADRSDGETVFLLIKIMTQLLEMKNENKKAGKFVVEFENDISFTVDIYQDGIARDQLEAAIKDIGKSVEKNGFTLKAVEDETKG